MHRVGADPADVVALVRAVDAAPGLRFAALWSHLAVADEIERRGDGPSPPSQLRRLAAARAALAAAGLDPPMVHMANSAGAIAVPGARLDMVRCGIALYGVVPMPALGPVLAADPAVAAVELLRPVLSLRVAGVARPAARRRGATLLRSASSASGPRSVVATVPIGYADGVPRRYFTAGGTVLIGGRRRPLAGTVTMDQIVVDCGTATLRCRWATRSSSSAARARSR